MESVAERIHRECSALLVRYLAGNMSQAGLPLDGTPGSLSEERSLLLLLWALSSGTGKTLDLLVRRSRHLVRSREQVLVRGKAGGAILAQPSSLLQAKTGNPAKFVSRVSKSTPVGNANHCIAWFVERVDEALRAFPQIRKGTWGEQASRRIREVQQARAIPGIQECFAVGLHLVTPSSTALRAATSLRSPLYSLVLEQIRIRRRITKSRIDIHSELASSALSDMETWRKMELLGALRAIEALQFALNKNGVQLRKRLSPIVGDGSCLAECGDFRVNWQQPTPLLVPSRTAPHESLARSISEELGINSSSDRTDLTIIFEGANSPSSIGESKYFESTKNAANQLSLAIQQLSRYSDQYVSDDALARKLVQNSFIFVPTAPRIEEVAHRADKSKSAPSVIVFGVDSEAQRWKNWAAKVVNGCLRE